ncbi:MAG: hypothetical protein WC824_03550 [Bacteroidota bacterium]|jgi:photosystem II stability/assembly factor-like uncharacterized protein
MDPNPRMKSLILICAVITVFPLLFNSQICAQSWWTPNPNRYPESITGVAWTKYCLYGYNDQGDIYSANYRIPQENEWGLSMSGHISGMRKTTTDMRYSVGENGSIYTVDLKQKRYLRVTPVTSANLNAVCYISTGGGIGSVDRLFAAGEKGTIVSCYPQIGTSSVLIENLFPDLYAIWQLDSRNIWAVGDSGCILVSSDNGTNWMMRASRPEFQYRCLSMRSSNMILIGGFDAGTRSALLIRTNRDLSEWKEQRFAGFGAVTGMQVRNNKVVVCGANGLLAVSEDSARTWTRAESGTRISFLDLFDSGDEIIAVGTNQSGQNFRSAHSTDSGKSWSARIEPEDSIGTISIAKNHIPAELMVTETGLVLRQESPQYRPTLHVLLRVPYPLYSCVEVDYNRWIVGGSDGRLYITDDYGRSWRGTEALDSDIITLESSWRDSLYALSRHGRLYRSGNQGDTWRLVHSFEKEQSITHLTIKFGDTCLATGLEGARGIARISTDGGWNWRTVLQYEGTVTGMDIDSSGALFVSTGDGKLLCSRDEGANWIPVFELPGQDFRDVSVVSRTELYLIAGGNAVWYTRDRGETWTPTYLEGQSVDRILATSYLRWVAWGTQASLVSYSFSGSYTVPIRKEWPKLLAAASRTGRDFIAVGEHGKIFRYEWTYSYQYDIHEVPVQVRHDLHDVAWLNEADLVAVGDSGIILKGTATGKNWDIAYHDPDRRSLFRVVAFPSGVAVAEGPSVLLRSDAAGSDWYELPFYPGSHLAPIDERMWFTAGEEGKVFLTEDAGRSWRHHGTLPLPVKEFAAFNGENVMALVDGEEGGAVRCRLLRSTDYGATWSTVFETGERIHGMRLFGGSRVILIGDDGQVFVGDSYGRHWIETRSHFSTTFNDAALIEMNSPPNQEYLFIADERAMDVLIMANPVLSVSSPQPVSPQLHITNLYPNPAHRFLAVSIEGDAHSAYRLSLHTLLGQEVWHRDFDLLADRVTETTVDVSAAIGGIYLLRLVAPRVNETRMVVIRR